jgi:hypothetical protein
MDPVPLAFKVPYNKTVYIKPNKIKISGHKKTHHTEVLACCTDGTEMSPLQEKQCPRTQFHKKCFFHVKGRLEEKGMALQNVHRESKVI